MLLVLLGCSVDEGALPPIPASHLVEKDPSLASGEHSPEAKQPSGAPPEHSSPLVEASLQLLTQDSTLWSNTKSCLVKSDSEDVASGWMFYAWNAEGTIGLVVSVHTAQPDGWSDDASKTLSIEQRDAFVMVEVGEQIPTNFCVSTISQISVHTVLESMEGAAILAKNDNGWTVTLREIALRDQYDGRRITLPITQIDVDDIQQVP